MPAVTDFLSVPHHQLLIGLGVLALLQLLAWIHGALRTDARTRAARAEIEAAQARALGPLAERIREIEGRLADDLARARRETAEQARDLRQELQRSITVLGEGQRRQLEAFATRLQAFEAQVEQAQAQQRETVDARLTDLREVFVRTGREQREEMARTLDRLGRQQNESVRTATEAQRERLGAFERRLGQLTETLGTRFEKLREENGRRLEEMRRTVDEKLQSTLDKRLGESFRLVSERLESVHKGLGEMQELATGVGDLKRVLTNVKSRGTWGEVQLGRLLEDMLTPDQYARNVAVKPGSAERVEFAIRLPGPDAGGAPVWLPIVAKFPRED